MQILGDQEKSTCIKSLLTEQRDLALQAAGHSLSAIHLKQRLFVYHRYLIALERHQISKTTNCSVQSRKNLNQAKAEQLKKMEFQVSATNTKISFIKVAITFSFFLYSFLKKSRSTEQLLQHSATNAAIEKATFGLARVGTRAALNFSFAFLRRAWRSGEDTELCSELLLEALEALQGLPEASLFDSAQVSPLWLEVLDRSIKFLRQVVVGDSIMGGRCSVPRSDRHIALSLLLELESQKGTLSASLEAILLLLSLWENEKDTDDNRTQQLPHNSGAPLVGILKRYEAITYSTESNTFLSDNTSTPTESFLR